MMKLSVVDVVANSFDRCVNPTKDARRELSSKTSEKGCVFSQGPILLGKSSPLELFDRDARSERVLLAFHCSTLDAKVQSMFAGGGPRVRKDKDLVREVWARAIDLRFPGLSIIMG